MEEEERARFNAEQEARALQEEERLNLEVAWELQRQLDERQQNKLVSIAQARRNMITYLKNQGGYKESYFKRMSMMTSGPIFERVWDHVNTFIPIGSEVEKDSSKPSERETSKIVEEEKVERRYRINILPPSNPIDMKILVDPEQDDDIWKNQNQWKIISWKLYETCGVHTLMVDEVVEEVMEMANDQAEALFDQKVADECLDDEHVEERRPNKRIKVTQEEMVKDEKPKKV
ncbi:hypothetical protein Tco_0065489 [Tanacetum coccineum]